MKSADPRVKRDRELYGVDTSKLWPAIDRDRAACKLLAANVLVTSEKLKAFAPSRQGMLGITCDYCGLSANVAKSEPQRCLGCGAPLPLQPTRVLVFHRPLTAQELRTGIVVCDASEPPPQWVER